MIHQSSINHPLINDSPLILPTINGLSMDQYWIINGLD